jgi:hypothetical protein
MNMKVMPMEVIGEGTTVEQKLSASFQLKSGRIMSCICVYLRFLKTLERPGM